MSAAAELELVNGLRDAAALVRLVQGLMRPDQVQKWFCINEHMQVDGESGPLRARERAGLIWSTRCTVSDQAEVAYQELAASWFLIRHAESVLTQEQHRQWLELCRSVGVDLEGVKQCIERFRRSRGRK